MAEITIWARSMTVVAILLKSKTIACFVAGQFRIFVVTERSRKKIVTSCDIQLALLAFLNFLLLLVGKLKIKLSHDLATSFACPGEDMMQQYFHCIDVQRNYFCTMSALGLGVRLMGKQAVTRFSCWRE